MEAQFSKLRVYGALAIGLTAFGFAPILVKYATAYSPLVIAALRTVFAVAILIPFYLYSLKHNEKALIRDKHESKWVALSGILLGLHFLCWIGSLYYTSVASASVLVTIHPIILISVERLFFKVKFQSTVWIGVVIAFSGSLLLGISDYNSESTFPNPVLGNALAFTGALIFAAYFLIGGKIRKKRSWIGYVFPVYFYSALTCVIVLLAFEGFSFRVDPFVVLIGFSLALGAQVMGHGSLNYAVKYVSPTILSTLILVEPIMASILALLIFTELPSIYSIIAMLIVLVGVSITWRRKKPKQVKIVN